MKEHGAGQHERARNRRRLGTALEFMRLLWAVDHRLQSRSKRMIRSVGITGPQRLVIRIVGLFPGISAGELAHVLCVHPSTLTGVLKRLAERELLVSGRSSEDGRRAQLVLTPNGKLLCRTSNRGTIEEAVTRALKRADRSRLEATRDVLRLLEEELR